MVTALAFLPKDQVCDIMPQSWNILQRCMYVSRYKVRLEPAEVVHLGWKDGKYPPSTWSVYASVLLLAEDPCTNNFWKADKAGLLVSWMRLIQKYKITKSLKRQKERCEVILRAC